jgi:UDP-N-acetylglucosamine--N-acetylmuramyl-(pentapeptide) pyrophosphoryl-undecaprenol N-acetylglucosamine transferase
MGKGRIYNMKEKRILFTGGGTAGHVIVNVALIPVFLQEGWKIDYIGSKNGIERDLIEPLEGVTYHSISTGKLRRYMSKENFKDPFKVMKGTMQAYRIMGKVKPHVIFSKGGFVSVPVLFASWLRNLPAVIHESDITPGLANKLAMPFAKKIVTTFAETVSHVSAKKAEWVGAVVRDELIQGNRRVGLEKLGFSPDKSVLLIMGGSGGSQIINESVRSSLDTLLQEFQIVHICGKNQLDESVKREGYVQFEYVNEGLNDLFAASDYVLSRAGSNAIFEFLALRKPMLLIPLSKKASRGDQLLNASSFKKQGYADVLEEEDLTSATLIQHLQDLKEHRNEILRNMSHYESQEAKQRVIEIIKEHAKK